VTVPDKTVGGQALRDAPLDREASLPVRVAKWISAEILEGRLAPGARLPTEQELSAMFGVSRNVVREAVAHLRAEGIVRSRQGAGVFVADLRPLPSLRLDRDELADPQEIRKLFELREILEIAAAGLAAERRTKEGLAGVTAAVRHLEQDSQSIDADLEFHRAVAAATGNNFIHVFLTFTSEHVRETIRAGRDALDPKVNKRIQVEEHRAIYDAIVKRQPDKAREAMRQHLINAAKRMRLEVATHGGGSPGEGRGEGSTPASPRGNK
jgi:GntR family transcriptional regulator, transcriptional repressor for pyruvate dehydrogenase complex